MRIFFATHHGKNPHQRRGGPVEQRACGRNTPPPNPYLQKDKKTLDRGSFCEIETVHSLWLPTGVNFRRYLAPSKFRSHGIRQYESRSRPSVVPSLHERTGDRSPSHSNLISFESVRKRCAFERPSTSYPDSGLRATRPDEIEKGDSQL